MGYAEAIEQQMRQIQYWRSPTGLEHAKRLRHRDDDGSETREMIVSCLEDSTPYYVAPPLDEVLGQVASSMPSMTLTPELLPTEAGFILFDRAIPVPDIPGRTADESLKAILWAVGHWYTEDGGEEGLVAYFFTVLPSAGLPFLSSQIYWQYGQLSSDLQVGDTEDHAFIAHGVRQRAILLAFFSFIRQRILTTSQHIVQNRAARRRIAKVLPHEPIVRVVELRRREYQQADESHDRHIEYTCQWLVRGHWRQQYYPVSNEHRPIWILPHIKGPADKPLKTPALTAYEVRR